MPDTLEEKAAAILSQGRLTITRLYAPLNPDGFEPWIVARCQGLTGEYALHWNPRDNAYSCSCPELKGGCSHILALKLVVEDWQEIPTIPDPTKDVRRRPGIPTR